MLMYFTIFLIRKIASKEDYSLGQIQCTHHILTSANGATDCGIKLNLSQGLRRGFELTGSKPP